MSLLRWNLLPTKLNPAALAVEQATDKYPVFKEIKHELPTHAVRDIPPEQCPMKRKTHEGFKSDKLFGLKFSHSRKHACIDLISVIPNVLTKFCTPDKLQSGFIKNGMLDAKSRTFPSFNGMFSTCKSNPTIEVYDHIHSLIGDLVLQYDKHGNADNNFLDACHIKRDEGEGAMRDSNALHLRRATIANHSAIVESRGAEVRKNRLHLLTKMQESNQKHVDKIELNRQACFLLLKHAADEELVDQQACNESFDDLEACALDIFGKLKAPMLKAFVVAHDNALKKLKDIPKRGNVEEAKADPPVMNSILMAHNCRTKPNLLEGNFPYSDEELAKYAADDEEESASTELVVSTVRLGEHDDLLSSELLSSQMWRANAVRLFNLHKNGVRRVDPSSDVSEEVRKKADVLVKILRQRFRTFLKQRISSKAKRSHWSVNFACNNLPVVAAVMALSGHLKSDLECLHDRDSLLITDASCFIKCNEHDYKDKEGTYLCFDTVRNVFVRSGKVAGRGFIVRGDEHLKASKAARPSSQLYRQYPSKESDRATNKRKGHFESLLQVVATGFDPNSEEIKSLQLDYKNGGVFVLTRGDVDRIKSSMKNLKCSDNEKFQHMLACLMELGYDLALSPEDIVSTNPGFESVLCVISSNE